MKTNQCTCIKFEKGIKRSFTKQANGVGQFKIKTCRHPMNCKNDEQLLRNFGLKRKNGYKFIQYLQNQYIMIMYMS